jgi:ABC-type branched-subunit amino acid transport system substrate-binding protein
VKGKQFRLLVALVAAVGLIGASVGIASANTRTQSSAPGVTKNSINVAALVSKPTFAAAELGAQARFDRENDNGGVFKRKINIVDTADDKFDPTTNVQEVRRVVSSGDVFAMVPTVTVVLGAADYLAQQKIPFFGWGISAGFCGNEYGYGYTGCVAPAEPVYGNTFMPEAGAKALGKDPKGLTVAIIAEDTDAARSGIGTLTGAAESLGMKVVYGKGVVPAPPATVGDFKPFAQDIMTSNGGQAPDIIIILFASIPSTLGLQGELQAMGFKGPIENTQTYDPQLAAPSKGGSVYVQFGAFETADDVPGVKQMMEDLEAADAPLGVLSAVGYLSADMFIQALKKAGKNLTTASFQKAASKLKYSVDKTAGPTQFPRDRVQASACGTLVTSNGTGYDVTVPYFCGTSVKVN